MNVLFFHLMPYAYLDMSYQEKYRTDWVVLPSDGHQIGGCGC